MPMPLPSSRCSLNPAISIFAASFPELDLVEEADWEEHVEFLSLSDAGLEEEGDGNSPENDNVVDYMEWFYDEPVYE